MSDPVDHIIRPNLPWRDESLTECGKDTTKVRAAITRDAAVAKVKKQGQQRAAMSTCMTCWQTAEYNRDWAQSPTEVMAREAKRVHWAGSQETDTHLDRELRAIEALVAAHRDEFDGYLTGLGETVKLDALRAQRARNQARQALGRGAGTTL